MSYQVLARKWRPKNFGTLVGQEHVVRALTHALDQQRLHHAYLFTGTRGVGKTTLSRILAKSLNCVGPDGNGDITSTPCGVCRVCTEIDAGRFVDYIEMDAASNRGVDEMAQLLEQAVYAPSNARFKVYMIDEVHMLTNHAFNSMLKTLEEPPEHVKFILATTDPQKIPVTVLSRCLQFNLKQMPPAQIVGHLDHILREEGIAFEAPSLRLLARAASGSMRDALSLTDQAIAYSAGEVTEETVRGMLGALDQTYLVRILEALAVSDGPQLLSVADEIAGRSLSYPAALQDLGGLLHRVALAQTVPDAIDDSAPDAAAVRRLATLFSPEEVQLHYQIVTHGRSELGLAPDEYAGFTMTLMRMLAFRPVMSGGQAAATPSGAKAGTPSPGSKSAAAPEPQRDVSTASGRVRVSPAADALAASRRTGTSASPAPLLREPTTAFQAVRVAAPEPGQSRAPAATEASVIEPVPAPAANASAPPGLSFDGDWLALAGRIKLSGFARQLVQQAEFISLEDNLFRIRVPIKSLLDAGTLDKLKTALSDHFGQPVRIEAEVGAVRGATVAAVEQGERAARQAEAVAAIDADPFVQALKRDFGATVVPGSIRPA